jgi:hypothetical protein
VWLAEFEPGASRVLSHVSKRSLFIQSDHESKSGETQVREEDREKLTERLPRLEEHLFDLIGVLPLFLIVKSMVDVSPLGMTTLTVQLTVVGVMMTLPAQLTVVSVVWGCRGRRAAVITSLVSIPVMGIAGLAVTSGFLAVIAYYAVSLWYLDATPAQRVLSVFASSDGNDSRRELLRRFFERA